MKEEQQHDETCEHCAKDKEYYLADNVFKFITHGTENFGSLIRSICIVMYMADQYASNYKIDNFFDEICQAYKSMKVYEKENIK